MKLAANLFAALLVLLAAQSRIGAIRLSEPSGEKSLSASRPARLPTLRRAFLPTGLRKSGARPSWSRMFPALAATSPPIASPRRPPTATHC